MKHNQPKNKFTKIGSYCGGCEELLVDGKCPKCKKDFPSSPEIEEAIRKVAHYKFDKRL